MRYANVYDYLLRHQAMQQYAELPLELFDHTRDIDRAYWQTILLIF